VDKTTLSPTIFTPVRCTYMGSMVQTLPQIAAENESGYLVGMLDRFGG